MKTDLKSPLEKEDEEKLDLEKTWHMTKCALCHEKLSMLDADTIYEGSAFIHKGGTCVKSK